jgi:hypothetical protein
MKNLFLFILIGLFMIATSCGNKGKKQESGQTAAPSGTESQASASVVKKYGVKSGIITFSLETNMGGPKLVKKVYFDDYGTRETAETFVDDKLQDKTINKGDGYFYQIRNNSGTKTKQAAASGTEMKFDFSETAFPENMKKEYNLSKLPNETICGKDCEVFSTEYQKMKTKYAGWNGITLLLDTSSPMGNSIMTSRMIATEFQDNVAIPASVWEIPAGIKMIEK